LVGVDEKQAIAALGEPGDPTNPAQVAVAWWAGLLGDLDLARDLTYHPPAWGDYQWAISHLAGRSMKRMIEAYLAGDTETARTIHLRLSPVINALMTTAANPVPLKGVINELGFNAGPFRLPLTPLPADELAKVVKVVKDAGDVITFKPGVRVAQRSS